MQSLQRAAVVFIGIAVLLLVPFLTWKNQMAQRHRGYAEAVLQSFCTELCQKGRCETAAYRNCQKRLSAAGKKYELYISEFMREEGENVCWYFISWEEIQKSLLENGVYYFKPASRLEVGVISVEQEVAEQFSCSGRIEAEHK